MYGNFRVLIKTIRASYDFTIKRKITILQGDSGMGKSYITEAISKIKKEPAFGTIDCKYKIREIPSWEDLKDIIKMYKSTGMLPDNLKQDTLFIVDEDFDGLYNNLFYDYVRETDNFFLFISRAPLINLPYSITEIYKAVKYKKTITFQQLYKQNMKINKDYDLVIVEDSKAGFEFYSKAFKHVVSAKGKSNILNIALQNKDKKLLLIVDSAAFGSEIAKLNKELNRWSVNYDLFTPESFEWLLCSSGLVKSEIINEVIKDPYAMIDGTYFSWERYFTDLLIQETSRLHNAYRKSSLNDCFYKPCCVKNVPVYKCNLKQVQDKIGYVMDRYFKKQQDMNLF